MVAGDARSGRRVLIAHPSPDLYGADRVILESVSAFVQADWQVVVALPEDGPLTEELRQRGAEVRTVATIVLRKAFLRPAGLLTLLRSLPSAVLAGSRMIRCVKPDLVYVNTVTLPLWPALARLHRRRVLAHAHEAEDSVPRALRLALALPLMFAHTVVVNSDATAAVLGSSLPLLKRKIRRLYNGVSGPAAVVPVRQDLTGPVRLVFVGRLSERKAPDLAVKATAILRRRGRDVTLNVVGGVFPGYEWYEADLRELIMENGLEAVVTLSGFSPSVWGAYESADIALAPSRVESLGNSAIEAQLAGRPLVVSRIQGLTEVAADGKFARIVDGDDPQALADAVEGLIEDWPGARQLADSARHNAADRFSPERYYRAIVAIGSG